MIVDEEKKRKKNIILLIIVSIIVVAGVLCLFYFNINRPEKIFRKFLNYSNNKISSIYEYGNSLRDMMESFKSNTKISIERNGKKYDDVNIRYDQTLNYKKKQIKMLAEIDNDKDNLISIYSFLDKKSITFKSEQINDKAIVNSSKKVEKLWNIIGDNSNIQTVVDGMIDSYPKHYKDDVNIISNKSKISIKNVFNVKSYTLSYVGDASYNLIKNILNDMNAKKDVNEAWIKLFGDKYNLENIINNLNKEKINNISLTVYTYGITNKIAGFDISYGKYKFSNYNIKGEIYYGFNNKNDSYYFIGSGASKIEGTVYKNNKELGNITCDSNDNLYNIIYKDKSHNVTFKVDSSNEKIINLNFDYSTNVIKVGISTSIDMNTKPKFSGITDKVNYSDLTNKDELINKGYIIIKRSSLYTLYEDINNDKNIEKDMEVFKEDVKNKVLVIQKEVNTNYSDKSGCVNLDKIIGNGYFGYLKVINVNGKYQAYITLGKDNLVVENYTIDNIKNNKYTVTQKDSNKNYSC